MADQSSQWDVVSSQPTPPHSEWDVVSSQPEHPGSSPPSVIPGTEYLGGKLPGPPKPPNAILNPPSSGAPQWQREAYEAKYGVPAPANLGTAFERPAQEIAAGIERVAGAKSGADVAGGASQALRGAVSAYTGPEAIGPLLAGNPVGAAATMAGAGLAQAGTESLLKKAGVPEGYANLAGDLAGLIAAGGGTKYLLDKAYRMAGEPQVKLGRFATPKEFRDMTDEELVAHANGLEANPPKNYDWQREQIAMEALRRQAARGMSPGAPVAPGGATPRPSTPPPSATTQIAAPAPVADSATAPPASDTAIVRSRTYDTPDGRATVAAVGSQQVSYTVAAPDGTISRKRVPLEQFQRMLTNAVATPPATATSAPNASPTPPVAPAAAGQPPTVAAPPTAAPEVAQTTDPTVQAVYQLEMDLGRPPQVSELQRALKLGYGAAARLRQEAYSPAAMAPQPGLQAQGGDQTPVPNPSGADLKTQPVVLQDFVAGRGGFAGPARMVVRSERPVTPDELRQAFFPDIGPDRLQIQKLRADDFMSAVQPGRQPFVLQFRGENGRLTSAPEGIEQRLGLAAGEAYHAPPADTGATSAPQPPQTIPETPGKEQGVASAVLRDAKPIPPGGTPEIGAPAPRDPRYEAAAKLAQESGSLSTSMLQRNLKMGFGAASQLLDALTADGVIGPRSPKGFARPFLQPASPATPAGEGRGIPPGYEIEAASTPVAPAPPHVSDTSGQLPTSFENPWEVVSHHPFPETPAVPPSAGEPGPAVPPETLPPSAGPATQAAAKPPSESIRKMSGLPEAESAVQDRSIDQVKADPAGMVADYRKRFGDEISADNAAELFPEYSESDAARGANRTAVARAASWVADEALNQRLAEPDSAPVVFTAGGTGSGKSTAATAALKDGAIVYDSTLSVFDGAKRQIENAIESGRNVRVVYVYRDPLEAWDAAKARAEGEGAGRTVSVKTHAFSHKNAPATVAKLMDAFAKEPRVQFDFYDNSTAAPFEDGDRDLLSKGDYNGLQKRLEQRDQSRAAAPAAPPAGRVGEDVSGRAGESPARIDEGGRTPVRGTAGSVARGESAQGLPQPAQEVAHASAKPPAPGEPGWVGNVRTSDLQVDAPRFQFKQNVGQGGAGEEFREVQKWDPEKAGVLSVWKDPADGKTYVVNGHHRFEMAQRLGVPDITVRYLGAQTAQEARMKGALINIAEGRGEATDAAKVFRDSGMTPADLKAEGISLKGKIASDGLALSNLAQAIFDDVIDGSLPITRGVILGSIPNPADQRALYDLIKQRERGGKRLSNDTLEELIRMNQRTSTTTESNEADGQSNLFGAEEMTRSLLPEKADVSAYVRKQLLAERKLFGAVSTDAAAQRLGEAGNVIQAGENRSQFERTNQGALLYDKLSTKAGPIDDVLDQAARSLADGENGNEVKQRAYRAIRDHLTDQVRKLAGVPERDAAGFEGLRAAGPREAGAGQRNPAVEAPPEPEVGRAALRATPEQAPMRRRAPVPTSDDQHGLFSSETEQHSREAAQHDTDKLLGDRLTAQFQSGMAARPADLKPAANRGLFDEGTPEQENFFSGESGSSRVIPALRDLHASLQQRFGDKAPKANYSGLTGLMRTFLPGRNLAEVEAASRPVFEAALPAASSDAITSTILQSAIPAIRQALKGSGHLWEELQLFYIESRLQGLSQRWMDFGEQAEQMNDEELRQAVQETPDGEPSPLLDMLRPIEGRGGIRQDLGQTAAALVESGDWGTLRKLLAENYYDAAARVAQMMPPDRFAEMQKAVASDPQVKEADRLYGDLIEKPMAESHAINEGVFSNSLGPASRYYPLVPLNKEQVGPPGRRLAYHRPQNAANKFATGLSDAYDPSMEALRTRLTLGNRGNYKAQLLQRMEESGWLIPEAKAYRTPEHQLAMTGPDGEEYAAVRVEVGQARTLIQNGRMVHLPARFRAMPEFMNRGVSAILEREPLDPDAAIAAMRWANTLATKGPLEVVFHSAGVLGSLYANTPFLGGSGLDKALSVPLMKWFGIRGKLFSIDPTSPENVAKLHEMAKAGALPAKTGKVTYSKEYAEMTGAKRERLSFAPVLYGPKGVDTRARILMYDIFKAAYPNGTPSEMHHFINQLGNYLPEMQGPIEAAVKRIGMGPFATAGMTRIVNSIHSITGTGPQAGRTLESRLWWWLTSSALIATAAWVVAYKHLAGQYPWEDKRAQFFQLPVGGGRGYLDQFRHSEIGNSLWGRGPETGYLNFAFFDNPLALRGTRAVGAADAFKAHQLGANAGQMTEAAQKGVMNSLLHPMLGPAARALFVGITGESPYITSFRDRGNVALRTYPAIDPRTPPGLPTIRARAWAAAKQLNSFYTEGAENLGELTGFSQPGRNERGSWWIKEGANIVAPGFVGNPSNPWKAGNAIRQEQRIERRPAR